MTTILVILMNDHNNDMMFMTKNPTYNVYEDKESCDRIAPAKIFSCKDKFMHNMFFTFVHLSVAPTLTESLSIEVYTLLA